MLAATAGAEVAETVVADSSLSLRWLEAIQKKHTLFNNVVCHQLL